MNNLHKALETPAHLADQAVPELASCALVLHDHVQCIDVDARAVLPQFANVTALTSVSQEHYGFEAVLVECREVGEQ